MKRTIITLAALVLASAAQAEVTDLTGKPVMTMDDMVAAGTASSVAPTKVTDMTGTVYDFDNSSYRAISTSGLTGYTFNSGYLTFAAWINVDTVTSGNDTTHNRALFGVGGDSDGIKFGFDSGSLKFTTKNIAHKTATTVATGTWTLVGFTVDLSESGNVSVYSATMDGSAIGAGSTETVATGNWNDISATSSFGLGSASGTSNRDGFKGMIGNAMVFYTGEAVSFDAIKDAIGVAPTAVAPAVPEPTTATLSLLALAGLAARRRRK